MPLIYLIFVTLLARNLPKVKLYPGIQIYLTDYKQLWYNYLVRGSEIPYKLSSLIINNPVENAVSN